jgi:hypothetical protein
VKRGDDDEDEDDVRDVGEVVVDDEMDEGDDVEAVISDEREVEEEWMVALGAAEEEEDDDITWSLFEWLVGMMDGEERDGVDEGGRWERGGERRWREVNRMLDMAAISWTCV